MSEKSVRGYKEVLKALDEIISQSHRPDNLLGLLDDYLAVVSNYQIDRLWLYDEIVVRLDGLRDPLSDSPNQNYLSPERFKKESKFLKAFLNGTLCHVDHFDENEQGLLVNEAGNIIFPCAQRVLGSEVDMVEAAILFLLKNNNCYYYEKWIGEIFTLEDENKGFSLDNLKHMDLSGSGIEALKELLIDKGCYLFEKHVFFKTLTKKKEGDKESKIFGIRNNEGLYTHQVGQFYGIKARVESFIKGQYEDSGDLMSLVNTFDYPKEVLKSMGEPKEGGCDDFDPMDIMPNLFGVEKSKFHLEWFKLFIYSQFYRMENEGETVAQYIFYLQGPQGCGKNVFFDNILPQKLKNIPSIYNHCDTSRILSMKNFGASTIDVEAFEQMRGTIIHHTDEIKNFGGDTEQNKSISSKGKVSCRRKYTKAKSDFIFRGLLVASLNPNSRGDLPRDESGNRRTIINILEPSDKSQNPEFLGRQVIDKLQGEYGDKIRSYFYSIWKESSKQEKKQMLEVSHDLEQGLAKNIRKATYKKVSTESAVYEIEEYLKAYLAWCVHLLTFGTNCKKMNKWILKNCDIDTLNKISSNDFLALSEYQLKSVNTNYATDIKFEPITELMGCELDIKSEVLKEKPGWQRHVDNRDKYDKKRYFVDPKNFSKGMRELGFVKAEDEGRKSIKRIKSYVAKPDIMPDEKTGVMNKFYVMDNIVEKRRYFKLPGGYGRPETIHELLKQSCNFDLNNYIENSTLLNKIPDQEVSKEDKSEEAKGGENV